MILVTESNEERRQNLFFLASANTHSAAQALFCSWAINILAVLSSVGRAPVIALLAFFLLPFNTIGRVVIVVCFRQQTGFVPGFQNVPASQPKTLLVNVGMLHELEWSLNKNDL